MKNINHVPVKQKGFSVLEVLVALSLSLIIIAGVAASVTQAIKNNRLLSAQTDMQNTANILHNQLGAIFKNVMSSPCGNFESMLSPDGASGLGQFKRAYKSRSGRELVQNTYPILMPYKINSSSELSGVPKTVITGDDLPLFLIGIAGHPNEPKMIDGKPLSEKLTDIVEGSEYFVAMDLAHHILLMNDKRNSSAAQSVVRGGRDVGETISTSKIPSDVIGKKGVPWIITDCHEATLFLSSQRETVKSRFVPVDDDLLFGNTGYLEDNTLLTPIAVNAYYLSQTKAESQPSFSRFNLTSKQKTSTPIMGGVRSIHFSWGLGSPDKGMVQGYFDTAKLLNKIAKKTKGSQSKKITQSFLREHLISVRITAVVEAYNEDSHYAVINEESGEISNLSTAMQRTYTVRNHTSRQK